MSFVRLYAGPRELTAEERGPLVAVSCASCQHFDADALDFAGHGFCTQRGSWHNGHAMPPTEGCTQWEAADAPEETV